MKKSFLNRRFLSVFLIPLVALSLSACDSDSNLDSVDNFNYVVLTPLDEDDMIPTDQLVLSMEGLGSLVAIADSQLTWIDMMHYAVDDEYLAQAEYRLILETYGSIKPYSNIVLSEGNHLSLLGQLFDLYQLPFPSDPSAGHVVLPNSLLEAAQIGVEAEINNIEMYRYFMTLQIEANMTTVFQLLMDASMNHLAAFERQVDRLT
jgi:hypothetical protein